MRDRYLNRRQQPVASFARLKLFSLHFFLYLLADAYPFKRRVRRVAKLKLSRNRRGAVLCFKTGTGTGAVFAPHRVSCRCAAANGRLKKCDTFFFTKPIINIIRVLIAIFLSRIVLKCFDDPLSTLSSIS